MSHFTESEFVDLLDDRLAPERASHAGACAACRARLDGLRDVLGRTAGVHVPEPPPLFWQQLSARVRDGLDADATGRSAWLPPFRWARAAWAGAAAVLVLLAGVWGFRTDRAVAPAPGTAPHVPVAGGVDPRAGLDQWEAEEAWALVRAAAEQLGWEEARDAGITPRPGSVESAMSGLTDSERDRLIRLLEEELKRSGA